MSTIGDISNKTKWIVSKKYVQATIIIALMTLVVAVPLITRAFALTDLGNAGVFEMDGNNITKESSGPLPTDWAALFGPTGNKLTLPPGGLDSGFVNDAVPTPDTTVFNTGSKDILNLPNSGWTCTSSPVLDKDKILDAYSLAIVPSSGPRANHLLVYAAMERASNLGSEDLGIWLFQDNRTDCNSPNKVGTTQFMGNHTVGDVLLTATYSTAGVVDLLNAYKWVGTGGDVSGTLQTITTGAATDCQTASVSANFCARSNSVAFDGIPWPVQAAAKCPTGQLCPGDFFELGIDLTGLFGQNAPCVNRFLFDTRSSPSPTADLHDFAIGSLSTCPKAHITTSVSPATIVLGTSANDTATVKLTQTGGTVNGTVNFNVYGPFTSPPTNTSCTASSLVKTFSPVSIGPGTTPQSATSGPFTPALPGYYTWIATYNPVTARNGNTVSTHCADPTELLLVVSTRITTSVSPTTVALGSSANDTATVTLKPDGLTVSGSVTFKVYGPFGSAPISTSCTGSFTTLGPVAISGPSPATATSPSFTATLPGYYAWTAAYTSNGPANGPNASTSCADPGETLLVINSTAITSVSPPTITFGQSSTDTATVTLNPSTQTVMGTVTFTVYGPVTTNTPTCTATNLLATIPNVPISGPGTGATATGTFKPPATGFYFWIAVYSPAGPANGPTATTKCGDGGETLVVLSIPKITGFGFTNTPTSNDPTLGSGDVTYKWTIHNYGTAAVTLSGSLAVSGTATVACTGGTTQSISGSLAAGGETSFSISCHYTGNSGQTVSATITAMFTDINNVTGAVSGSPTTYTFTIQTT